MVWRAAINERKHLVKRIGSWQLLIAGALMLGACGSDSSSTVEKLFINEVLPSNNAGCTDDAGEKDDWVELYNGGDEAVDLEGFSISDDATKPTKAVFGKGLAIPAKGYLLLWLDNTTSQGTTHLSFKLKQEGEAILLYDAAQNILDQYQWTGATQNISFARLPDGSGAFAICATPTCGKANGTACGQ